MEDYRAVGKRNMCWIKWEFSEISVANKETQRLALATTRNTQGGGGQGGKNRPGGGGDEKRVTLQNGESRKCLGRVAEYKARTY